MCVLCLFVPYPSTFVGEVTILSLRNVLHTYVQLMWSEVIGCVWQQAAALLCKEIPTCQHLAIKGCLIIATLSGVGSKPRAPSSATTAGCLVTKLYGVLKPMGQCFFIYRSDSMIMWWIRCRCAVILVAAKLLIM